MPGDIRLRSQPSANIMDRQRKLAEMYTARAFRPGHVEPFIHKNARSSPVATIYLFRLRNGIARQGRKLFARQILLPYLDPINPRRGSTPDTLEQRLMPIAAFSSKTLSICDITK